MKNLYFISLTGLSLMLFLSFGASAAEPPYISPINDKTAAVGEPFILDIDAMDADPAETYELLDARPGMTIDPLTGVINWTPAAPDEGGIVSVRAYNSEGESSRSFYIYVTDEIICPTNLVSYWKLDDASDSIYMDYTGGYTAKSLSPLEDIEGVVNRAKQFSPVGKIDTFVNVPDSGQYDFARSGGFSVSMWFNYQGQHTGVDNNQVLIARGAATTSFDITFMMVFIDVETDPSIPKITFGLRPKSTEDVFNVTPDDTIKINQWYHVVAVYDGPPNPSDPANLNVYINNIKYTYSHVFGPYDFTYLPNFDLNIGYWDVYATNKFPFNGIMDEILIYDKALSDSEVSDIYNDGLSGLPHCKAGNYFPLFTSTPIDSATQNVEYSYVASVNDYDGDPVTLSADTIPDWLSFYPGTGELWGTPDNTDVGDHNVSLHATDGNADVYQNFIITVENVNDPPVVAEIPDQTIAEGQSFGQITLDNFVSDPDDADSTLTWRTIGQSNLNIEIINRVAAVAPIDPDWNGMETITFIAQDPMGLQDSAEVEFQITGINDSPVIGTIPDQTIAEGQSFSQINLDSFVSDVDNADSTLNWSTVGQIEISVSITNRVATLTVDPDWNGSEVIVFLVEDPLGGQDSDTAVLTVTAVNDPPVVSDIPDQSISEGQSNTLEIELDGFVADVDDPDSLISWTVTGYSHVTVELINRVAIITPPDDPEWNGSDTLIFTATDTSGASDMDISIFTVTPVNDPPTLNMAIPDTSAEAGKAFLFVFDQNTFMDIDQGDSLVYSASLPLGVSPPGWITFEPASRTFSGTPSEADIGLLEIIVTATDDGLASISDTFKIEVKMAVGIGNPLADLEIKIYPNPSSGSFVIESETFEMKDVIMEIYNEKGQLVWNREINDQIGTLHETIDLSHSPDGIYLLKMWTNSTVISKHLIIAH